MAKKAGIKPLRLTASLPIDLAAGIGITPQLILQISSKGVECKVAARPRLSLFNWNFNK